MTPSDQSDIRPWVVVRDDSVIIDWCHTRELAEASRAWHRLNGAEGRYRLDVMCTRPAEYDPDYSS